MENNRCNATAMALEGNRPITVDEFLYSYKPLEIKQSASFYQFSSLVKGCSSSDRLWKKEFFFISSNWVGYQVDVNIAPFPPFISPLGRLLPKGMFFFLCLSILLYLFLV